ncbi:Acyltransferase [Tangfeifania diversioriginum]|uniref:Acyltransferase n=1 Tax=Tangfeifania diversioriginum TaxID=1168035 RepID=A0A1M6B7P1_9BACT|nr:lysophospholipid acyltransferase family protein [Tangfeifania diversioriginum]SHI44667.1 Acyltransferase [Tangfeifania diversioriginum]
MIKAKHHWFLSPFLVWYGWMRIKMHFNKIRINGNLKNKKRPLLIIANHFSWWDGFFIASLNKKQFGKKFHILMEEKQLVENKILNQGGVFSLRKNSKDVVRSLQYSVELLKDPGNMVALFPQGQFESKYQHPLHFEKGLDWILKKLPNKVEMVFIVNLTEYFDSVKPNLYIYYKTYDYERKTLAGIEKDYNDFYEECFKKNITFKDN